MFEVNYGSNPIIPVTGGNDMPSLTAPECTAENHRATLLCGKDVLQALFTEKDSLLNLLLLLPVTMGILVVLIMLQKPDSGIKKEAINLIAGIVAGMAVSCWEFFAPQFGMLPDIGFWVIAFATLLMILSVLLQGGRQGGREEILIQQRLQK